MCVLGLALAACSPGPAAVPTAAPTAPVSSDSLVGFTIEHEGGTQRSGYTGISPKLEVRQEGGRWRISAYLGQKRTGGYSIEITKVTQQGGIARVIAFVQAPPAGAIVTQVITSPMDTVSIAGGPFAPNEVILFDQSGQELARTTP